MSSEHEESHELLSPNTNNNQFFSNVHSPADKVRFLLSDETAEGNEAVLGKYRPLFCQLDVLCHFPNGNTGWKELSRWLKYEERVDEGNRWSKPHVSTTSLHALMEVRGQLANNKACVVLNLDPSHECQASNGNATNGLKKTKSAVKESDFQTPETFDCTCGSAQERLMALICQEIQTQKGLDESQLEELKKILLAPHKHQHRRGKSAHGKDKNNESNVSLTTYPQGMTPDSLKAHKPNKRFGRKIMDDTETVNILVGHAEFLDAPVVFVSRLEKACVLGDLSEVDLPTRFMCVCVGPSSSATMAEYEEMGRALGALFTDKVFSEVAYKASGTEDILHGMEEYIDGLTVLPPSVWDPSVRLEPPMQTIPDDKVRRRLDNNSRYSLMQEDVGEQSHEDETLKRTGRLFGGMLNDMKRRYPHYLSDLRDGLHLQCVAAVVFLYFACVSAIITFGGLMGTATDQYMGTMESLLSGAICGLTYHAFSGQPLTIVGATGPLLVFESIMYTLCKDYGWDFLTFRFYTGAWVFIILMLIVAFDLSAMVAYITRFTEESFSVLISFIFIAEAFKKVIGVWKKYPMHVAAAREEIGFNCHCMGAALSNNATETSAAAAMVTDSSLNGTTEEPMKFMYETFNRTILIAKDCITIDDKIRVSYDCISEHDCEDHGWALEGPGCYVKSVTHGYPDVFLVSVFLFFTTFGIAYTLRCFRTSNFFPAFVRNTVADFAVLIGILVSVGIDYAIGVNTPKLQVPTEFKTSRDDRPWVVNPADVTVWWLVPLSLLPAIFATILIFLDQQITAVIVNRKDHKLKKGHGYHLDLFVLASLVMICSILGLPWFVAATVRSITHVKALLKLSEHAAPGEKPTFLGVREQRLTGICIHILIGVSVLLTAVLKFVPMAVLYGVFLYMGITSLFGVQFYERMLILFMPAKYQPDSVYLRHVPISRVHIFTAIQIVCMVIMWTLKSIRAVSITFPLMILALCFVRKAMEKFFCTNDLFWLDHLLPEITIRKNADAVKEMLEEKKDEKSTV